MDLESKEEVIARREAVLKVKEEEYDRKGSLMNARKDPWRVEKDMGKKIGEYHGNAVSKMRLVGNKQRYQIRWGA